MLREIIFYACQHFQGNILFRYSQKILEHTSKFIDLHKGTLSPLVKHLAAAEALKHASWLVLTLQVPALLSGFQPLLKKCQYFHIFNGNYLCKYTFSNLSYLGSREKRKKKNLVAFQSNSVGCCLIALETHFGQLVLTGFYKLGQSIPFLTIKESSVQNKDLWHLSQTLLLEEISQLDYSNRKGFVLTHFNLIFQERSKAENTWDNPLLSKCSFIWIV